MARRFTPVVDPEKARFEQDEESLRKHRQFDTPFALLPTDLNEKKQKGREDLQPLGRPSGELEQDEQGLWRKKVELFDKQKTWGRETVEYTDPEQARVEGNRGPKWGRPGVVGWGVQGNFGGRGQDVGLEVLQCGEVNQKLEKNERGLWVKKKAQPAETDEDRKGTSKGRWRCNICGKETSDSLEFCRDEHCGGTQPASTNPQKLKQSNPHEDPRLEAAKKKSRGTDDATQQALRALTQRRRQENEAKEQLGLLRKQQPGCGGQGGGRAAANYAATLNSRKQQVRPAPRIKHMSRWQGVQRTDEEAKKVVSKAVGGNVELSGAPLRVEDTDKAAAKKAQVAADDGEEHEDLAARIAASVSRSRSKSSYRSRSPKRRQRRSRSSPSPSAEPAEVVVDFF